MGFLLPPLSSTSPSSFSSSSSLLVSSHLLLSTKTPLAWKHKNQHDHQSPPFVFFSPHQLTTTKTTTTTTLNSCFTSFDIPEITATTTTNILSDASSTYSTTQSLFITTLLEMIHNNDDYYYSHFSSSFSSLFLLLSPLSLETTISSSSSPSSWWVLPMTLSCIAGASTCLGAAIVFVLNAKQIEKSMAFTLSLAASVMITVSVISIGPECLHNVLEIGTTATTTTMANVDWKIFENSIMFLPISILDPKGLYERILSFGLGCLSYWILSTKILSVVPEPEEFIVATPSKQTTTTTTTASSLLSSSLSSLSSSSPMTRTTKPTLEEFGNNTMTTKNMWSMKNITMTTRTNHLSEPVISLTTAATTTTSPIQMHNYKDDNDYRHQYQGTHGNDYYRDEANSVLSSSSLSSSTSSLSSSSSSSYSSYWRVTMLLFISLLVHNFPEGLAVAASTMESSQLGLAVTIGILIHNIPEGIAIAVPCMAARPDAPWLAFCLASASGLAEPIGAALALTLLSQTQQQQQQTGGDGFLYLFSDDYSLSSLSSSPVSSVSLSNTANNMVSTTMAATTTVATTTTTTTTATTMESLSVLPPLDNVLAFVAGIMCAVACLELYPQAWHHIMTNINHDGEQQEPRMIDEDDHDEDDDVTIHPSQNYRISPTGVSINGITTSRRNNPNNHQNHHDHSHHYENMQLGNTVLTKHNNNKEQENGDIFSFFKNIYNLDDNNNTNISNSNNKTIYIHGIDQMIWGTLVGIIIMVTTELFLEA